MGNVGSVVLELKVRRNPCSVALILISYFMKIAMLYCWNTPLKQIMIAINTILDLMSVRVRLVEQPSKKYMKPETCSFNFC